MKIGAEKMRPLTDPDEIGKRRSRLWRLQKEIRDTLNRSSIQCISLSVSAVENESFEVQMTLPAYSLFLIFLYISTSLPLSLRFDCSLLGWLSCYCFFPSSSQSQSKSEIWITSSCLCIWVCLFVDGEFLSGFVRPFTYLPHKEFHLSSFFLPKRQILY